MDPTYSFNQAANVLPLELKQCALAIPKTEKIIAEELRLRVGHPLSITCPNGEFYIPDSPVVLPEMLRSVLEIATQASVHTALEHIRNGFVTVKGGHRVGLCGSAVIRDGAIYNFNKISSVCVRIAHQIYGIADSVIREMRQSDRMESILILSPPGAGKTTLLRDLIRGLSEGIGGTAIRVGVVDERGELAAMQDGVAQMDLGSHTDIIDGCSKAVGLMLLLRGMNPQALAVDEITAPEDIEAMECVLGCGVSLLATAHGASVDDLRRRPLYLSMLERKIFRKVLLIECDRGSRKYRMEEIAC